MVYTILFSISQEYLSVRANFFKDGHELKEDRNPYFSSPGQSDHAGLDIYLLCGI